MEIDEETFVFLCVSSITKNKNQVQIIRAYDLIKVERNIKAALVFVGDGPDSDSLITAINNSPNKKSIHYVGRIPHDDMQYYYSIANCIVNASKEEGFGLPIIEAMAFGVPTVIFDDLDAVEDLYNEHCMIKVSKRTDEELSNAMKNAIDKSWNKAQIIEISKSFTVYQMARNYKILFEAYKNRNINITLSDIENLL